MMFVVIAAFLLCGCTSSQLTTAPDVLPQLIHRVPLPPWPSSTAERGVTLELKIHIAGDGSVDDVILMTPTRSSDWDSLALAEIRKWRFSPALFGGRPVSLWLRQTVRIRFEELTSLPIAEIVCSERGLADSLYALLVSGMLFDSLARKFSMSSSREHGGVVGEVDLRTLPTHIRYQLVNLREGDITEPIMVGRQFVIYKRLASGI